MEYWVIPDPSLHHSNTPLLQRSFLLRPRSKRLGLKWPVALLQVSFRAFGGADFVERAAKFFAQHHVRWDRQRLIQMERVAKSHHLQPHGRDGEIDFYRFRR